MYAFESHPEGSRPCGVGCDMVAWIYDGSDWGALIQHGIGTIVSSELAPLLYRYTSGGLAENDDLIDPPIAASYISFVRDLY